MLKISEFARLAKTTRRTLIFYDEKGIFSPAKVSSNGYRYYESDQLYQFELISGLRDLGLSLHDIQSVLSSHGKKLDQYLEYYQRKNQERIRHLKVIDQMLELHKHLDSPYEKINVGKIKIISSPDQEFWCTDLAVDCKPDDVAELYSEFMTDLGDITSKIPSQLGFLTKLPLNKSSEYMSAAFRFIKESTVMDDSDLMTKIIKPGGNYLSIKVNTNLEDILSGLDQLKNYVKKNNLEVDNIHLWQLNVDQHIVKNGSSAQQILQYRILDKDEK